MKKDPIALVCALADAPKVVPGSVFTNYCRVCNRQVMIAPSGQKVLKREPLVYIICGDCFKLTHFPEDKTEPAAPIDEIRQEVANSQPNMRKFRN